jgi:hypothetical protein
LQGQTFFKVFGAIKQKNLNRIVKFSKGYLFLGNRNVYVAVNETNNVVVLSPDGKNCKEILTKSNGLDRPFSLCINIDRSELLGLNKIPKIG